MPPCNLPFLFNVVFTLWLQKQQGTINEIANRFWKPYQGDGAFDFPLYVFPQWVCFTPSHPPMTCHRSIQETPSIHKVPLVELANHPMLLIFVLWDSS